MSAISNQVIAPSIPTKKCWSCDKTLEKVRQCTGCHVATYCSTDCQKVNWNEHKPNCKQLGIGKVKDKAHDLLSVSKKVVSKAGSLLIGNEANQRSALSIKEHLEEGTLTDQEAVLFLTQAQDTLKEMKKNFKQLQKGMEKSAKKAPRLLHVAQNFKTVHLNKKEGKT